MNIALASKAILLHYIVPSRFIQVDALPRTINNKVDENKLIEMGKIKQELFSVSEETTDATMMQIIKIWQMLLPNSQFDLDDNFFDCGGNSILLAELQLSYPFWNFLIIQLLKIWLKWLKTIYLCSKYNI